jgi:hypothetical protein
VGHFCQAPKRKLWFCYGCQRQFTAHEGIAGQRNERSQIGLQFWNYAVDGIEI